MFTNKLQYYYTTINIEKVSKNKYIILNIEKRAKD